VSLVSARERVVAFARRRPLFLCFSFSLCLFVFWLFWVWPPPLWYRWNNPRETSFMAMRRHNDPVAAIKRRYKPVSLLQMAPSLQRAVMIGEDTRFYTHHGIDWVEMRHAMGYPRDSFAWSSGRDRADAWNAVERSLLHPARIRGASTITQQLAKNLYLSPSRNPLRKVKEALTAWRLEFWLSKSRILELYLNSVEMGEEIWGAEAASQAYFRTSARNLSGEQSATLAALLPFPRSSNPYYRPGRMIWRRNLILDRMGGRPARVVPIDTGGVVVDSMR
jgi:monofunctional biosynthetic peptidoglycan transglycosylase